MNAISTAREVLQAQLEPIASEAAELKERLDTLDRSKAQLEAALKALAPSKKGKAKAARINAKPCARKPDVLSVCLALIEGNPSISKEDLIGLAKQKLVEELGFSRNGLALQLDKLLSSDSFAIAANGTVSIASDSSPAATELDRQKRQHGEDLLVEKPTRFGKVD